MVIPKDKQWNELSKHFTFYPSTRQIIVIDIKSIQTSCGFGVAIYTYEGERSIHFEWAYKKGEDGLENYIKEKNTKSLDGLPSRF